MKKPWKIANDRKVIPDPIDDVRCNNGGFPRYVLNQLKIFVPVGKDIKIVTPEK